MCLVNCVLRFGVFKNFQVIFNINKYMQNYNQTIPYKFNKRTSSAIRHSLWNFIIQLYITFSSKSFKGHNKAHYADDYLALFLMITVTQLL